MRMIDNLYIYIHYYDCVLISMIRMRMIIMIMIEMIVSIKNDEDISIATVLMSYHNKYYLLIINKNSNNYSTYYRPSGWIHRSNLRNAFESFSFQYCSTVRRIYAVMFIIMMIIVVWMMMITMKIKMILVMVILLIITYFYDNHDV